MNAEIGLPDLARMNRGLSQRNKQLLTASVDAALLIVSLLIAFHLRLGKWWPEEIVEQWWLLPAAPMAALPVFIHMGLYRTVLKYAGSKAFIEICKAVTIQALLLTGFAMLTVGRSASLSLFVIYWLTSLVSIVGIRFGTRTGLRSAMRSQRTPHRVIIYGAGSAGVELAQVLQAGCETEPVAFIDDKRSFHGSEILGLEVHPRSALGSLILRHNVSQVLLAIPSASVERRNEVLMLLERYPVQVKTVPSLHELVWERASVEQVRDVDIEDLLGREPVAPDPNLMAVCVTGKHVLITGAGGSIGSELARQILTMQPLQLVLYESSEFALYQIERELHEFQSACSGEIRKTEIVPVLGSVTDPAALEAVFGAFPVDTVYHAAAYKHVPLVEQNPAAGAYNNVFGTMFTAKAAMAAKVRTFILISTDKAVRPTNIMGASKRMAEMVLQGLAEHEMVLQGLIEQYQTTCFSIVRFGNVLGSSGSVVPLFREQIRANGPVTVTHKQVIRYFMTIPEAAQLVIQAGAMGKGGDVFVLDMGEPVRIYDLARRMIALSGLTVRDSSNPDGDIEIEITGLRPGEKLFEELLIG
ncbi:MAG TPA: polysaccharide biosynthesis protein, partial [Gammaproteobacteria bacterium]|nr:polysaccharide biosynthesis protein [Gammaproteobacteria bacterium]